MKIFQVFIIIFFIKISKCQNLASENDIISINFMINERKSYVFYFSPEAKSNLIILSFDPLSEYINPGNIDVYLSHQYSDPNSTHNEKVCSIKSFYGCVYEIPATEMKLNHLFFLLECFSMHCQYKLRLTHSEEIHLYYDEIEHFSYKRSKTEMFNFTVPAQNSFERIIVSVKYKYISRDGDDYYGEHHDVVLTQGNPQIYKFSDQQIIVLNNNDTKLCFSCDISALVMCQTNSTIEIQLYLYKIMQNLLSFNKYYIDFVYFSKNNKYILELNPELLRNENFCLKINFNSLSGSQKTLYFDIDIDPINLENYRWKSSRSNYYYEEFDISISKAELNNLNLIGEKYFLVVSGDSQGIFSLFISQYINQNLPLYLGSVQSGLIANNEIINYDCQIWKNEEEIENLTLSATVMTGHINIYGRKCGIFKNCKQITKDDIVTLKEIDFKSTTEGVTTLTFKPDCDELAALCYYIFAIEGNSFTSNLTKYDLILKKNNTYVNLIENVCHESLINLKDYEQFKLFVESVNDEVIAVNFFINSDIEFFVSKDKICSSDDQNCLYKYGNLNNPVSFESEEFDSKISLNGTYFIMVFGMKSTSFMIFPEVRRKNKPKAFIKLLEGKTLRYFLTISKKIAYFEFLIDIHEETSIDINLQSNEVNFLIIYLQKDGSIPTSDNYYMSSLHSHLSFTHNSFEEVIYRVAIESKYFLNSYKDSKIDFSIMYSTGKTLTHLESNQPFYDIIKANTKKSFLYYVDLNDALVYATKHIINPSDSGDHITMIFSMFMQDKNAFRYPVYVTNESTIKLDQNKLNSLCRFRSQYYGDSHDGCPIYIFLNNSNEFDVQYTLNVRTIEFAVQLRQGKEQTFKMNEEEKNLILYFLPSSLIDSIEIYIYSLFFDFNVYVSTYNNNESLPFQFWKYPNEDYNQYQFLQKRRVSKILKNADFVNCWPKCVLLFNITEKDKNSFNDNNVEQEKLIHVLLTSDISEINENKPIHFNSEFHNIKFFIYDLNLALQNNFSILMDLTNFVGASEMYIIVNEGHKEVFPSFEIYDFFSIDGHLTLTNEELMEKIPSKLSDNNNSQMKLYIGIFCVNPKCESSLIVRTSNYFIRKVLHGHPYEFYLSNNSFHIFEYFHYVNKSFQIKVNKEIGNGTLLLIPCFKKTTIECLNDQMIFNKEIIKTEALYINNGNPQNYCLNCFYLIILTMTNNYNLKGTLNIILDQEYLILSDGHNYVDTVAENEENKYICKAPNTEELEITLNIQTNEPELYVSRTIGTPKIKSEFKASKQKGNIISLIIDPNNTFSENDEVYILVYGKTESNYSIKCRFKGSFSVLHAGLMEFSELLPLNTHKYIFYANEEEIYQNNPRLAIYYADNITDGISVKIQAKVLNNHQGSSPYSQELEIFENQTIYSFHSLVYHLFKRSALYEISISNLLYQKINYSISVETKNINILPYNTILSLSLMPDQWNYYEAYIPNKGLFTINLLECLGSVEIYTTDNYEKLLKNEFNQELKTFSGQDNMKIFKVNKGKFYFALFSNKKSFESDEFTQKPNYIQISTHFYDSYEEIPYYKLMVSDEGKLDWRLNKQKKIRLIFPNVFCVLECNQMFLKSINIDYKILVSESMNFLDSHGKCGIISFQELKIDRSTFSYKEMLNQELLNTSRTYNYDFDLDLERNYYITVIAKINGIDEEMPVLFYYKETEIKKLEVKVERVYSIGIIMLCILFLTLLALCGCYFCSVYRKLKNILKYEVKEVANISSITSLNTSNLNTSIEMKSNKLYQGLVEQLN